MNDIKRKQTENLSEEGFACLREGDFERALKISNQLKEKRFSSAFDIGAQAYAGLEELDKAVELLKEGVDLAPKAWPNWQLLGNYLSDLNEFDEAQDAYNKALECEGVWADSIYLNQAILLKRMREESNALIILKKVKGEDLYIQKSDAEISALRALNLIEDAEKIADQVLSIENIEKEDEEVVGGIAAQLGRIYLEQGKAEHEVRNFALHSLSYDQNNKMLLALIRDIDNLYSEDAKYYSALIHCTISELSPDYKEVKGYFCDYDVIASSEEQLLSFVKEFERETVSGGSYIIDDYRVLEENSQDPCGVYLRSDRSYYDSLE